MSLPRTRSWLPLAAIAVLIGFGSQRCGGQTPAPPPNVIAADHPWDDGSALDLSWTLSPDDAALESYQVMRTIASIDGQPVESEYAHVEFVDPGTTSYTVGDLRASMDFYDVKDAFGEQLDLAALKASGRKHFEVGHRFRVIAVAKDGKSLPMDSSG